MKYAITPLTTDNIADLVFLYGAVFGNKVTLDFVRKKFDTSYLGLGYFGHLAYHADKPVAFHGAVPFKMKYRNDFEIAAQYGDAMTLAGHTGKGLFTTLGQYTDELLQRSGIRFVWGFPNQNSEYGYLNKLGWKFKHRMQGFRIKTSTIAADKIVSRSAWMHKRYQDRLKRSFNPYLVSTFPKGSAYRQEDIVSTDRSEAYYHYKRFGGSFAIDLEGVIFWLKIKGGMLVGDVEITTGASFSSAIERLRNLASKNGIGEIIFQSSPDTLITELMLDHADQRFSSWVVGFKNFTSDFPIDQLTLTFGDLDTF